MIDYALYCKINHLCHNDGLTAQQIAREHHRLRYPF